MNKNNLSLITGILIYFISTILLLSSNLYAGSSDTKVALVPGGPHPYFAAWEQAGLDAVKDFGLFKEPNKYCFC